MTGEAYSDARALIANTTCKWLLLQFKSYNHASNSVAAGHGLVTAWLDLKMSFHIHHAKCKISFNKYENFHDCGSEPTKNKKSGITMSSRNRKG